MWREFDENHKEGSEINIPDGAVWENFYSNLFDDNTTKDVLHSPSDTNIARMNFPNQMLNEQFSERELSRIVKKLKNGKATGMDRISNEMIKASLPYMQQAYLKLFNMILSAQCIPSIWCKSIITPIHKSGSKSDPENFRPICVTSCLSKLFCLMLNERLTLFINKYEIMNVNQIGFKEKCRTADHLFTLKTLINKHVHNTRNGKIFACFVDFRKAFDSVWHKGLFLKLECLNISGNILEIIKDIYSKTTCSVKINDKMTQFFNYSKGVRQGCPLSPTLFNLYINDLINEVEAINPSPLHLHQEANVSCLLYADDLILLSRTQHGLQKMLDRLTEFCATWNLSVNTKKTKCITFQKKSRLNKKDSFYVNKNKIENVTQYSYLGITINSAGSFHIAMETLARKARRAIYALNSRYQIKRLPVKAALKLFDCVISPILLYCSEVWGAFHYTDYDRWDNNIIEKIHLSFCKHLLGVNRSTTNILVRGELGRFPLKNTIDNRCISFLRHIEESPPNSLVHLSLLANNDLPSYLNFNTHIDNIKSFTNSPNILEVNKNKVKLSLQMSYKKLWKSQLLISKKGKFLRDMDKEFQCQPYLLLHDYNFRQQRVFTAKLRTSDHTLAVEYGRRTTPKIKFEDRVCKLCSAQAVEDEMHFISECTLYSQIRIDFFEKCYDFFPNIRLLNMRDKFRFLFSIPEPTVMKEITSYLFKLSKMRAENQIVAPPL